MQKAAKAKKDLLADKKHDAQLQVKNLMTQIETMDNQISSTEDRIHEGEIQLTRLKTHSAFLLAQKNQKVEDFNKKREVYKRRLVRYYKSGPANIPMLLLRSKDYADFQTRFEYIKAIVKFDKGMLDKVKAMANEIEEQRKAVDTQMAKVRQVEKQLRLSQADLVAELGHKKGVMASLQSDIVAYDRAIQDLVKISDSIAQEIANQSASFSVGLHKDGFMAPVVCRMTSPFGWRVHPILGYRRMHTGQDLGCPYGTPIRAASSGRVFWASSKRGYGNTVILVHADNISTLYGHMSKIDVRAGQLVRRGQVIGNVGCTGLCTGNHLHYEVRINGNVINPAPYLR